MVSCATYLSHELLYATSDFQDWNLAHDINQSPGKPNDDYCRQREVDEQAFISPPFHKTDIKQV